MRVFIGQPMRDKLPETIELERTLAMAKMRDKFGDEVTEIPSYVPQFKDGNPIRCLGQSIKLMADADVVVCCAGWENARGCRIEREVAVEYGLMVIDLEYEQ